MHALRRRLAGWACAGAVALGIGACTSVPQASNARDAEARQFHTHPNSATIYVYRPDIPNFDAADSVLRMDSRLIGSTLPRTFFRIDARPGQRVLHGDARDTGRLVLDTKPGELYFVSLRVSADGVSHFERVLPETGKRDILRCCAMMENWAPGQRPLLR